VTHACFITATGTDVGKTHVTCALIRHWRRQGMGVRALKPVISGFSMDDETTDSHRILAAMGVEANAASLAAISPWRFAAPLSPDVAAAREGRRIDRQELTAFCRTAIAGAGGPLLIEGVGGTHVPIERHFLVADWMAALDIPVVLVAGSYLGTLSHSIASLEALAARTITVAAVVVSESERSPMPLAQTQTALAQQVQPVPVVCLGRGRDDEGIAALAELLGQKAPSP
jgi:dethiobiotin synthetase